MAEKKVVKKAAPVEVTEKISKAAPTPAAAPAAEKKERKIGLRKFKDDMVITLLVDYNPKRLTSASGLRFEHYEDGATVAEALAAGLTSGDLSWDTDHGYIKIGAEFDEDAEKKTKPEPKAVKEPKAKKVKAAAVEAEEETEEAEEETEEAE